MGIMGIREGGMGFRLVNGLKLIGVNVVGCGIGRGVGGLLGVDEMMGGIGGV